MHAPALTSQTHLTHKLNTLLHEQRVPAVVSRASAALSVQLRHRERPARCEHVEQHGIGQHVRGVAAERGAVPWRARVQQWVQYECSTIQGYPCEQNRRGYKDEQQRGPRISLLHGRWFEEKYVGTQRRCWNPTGLKREVLGLHGRQAVKAKKCPFVDEEARREGHGADQPQHLIVSQGRVIINSFSEEHRS